MFKKAIFITLMGISSASFADWQVKVGASAIAPTQDTAILGGAAVVKADQEIAFTPSVEYIFGQTPFSVELLLATPISHDVLLDGQKAVKLKHLPPTITAKYNFKNSTRFTPYIGVGGTAFIAWDEETSGGLEGTKVKVKEDFGFAGQVGFNFQPADAKNWGVFADVRYAQVESDVKLDGKGIGTLKVNPLVYTLGYSYRF